ncbi:serine/threonine protein phosphatase [Mycolicibacterium phlei]|uniref:Serine/threonine protein phosphatase PstP n=1 Tax=Mycolicibacterium phlei DSM 43239 = CCUG 21000 TaxID=1226750 RepID=A0A5N5V1V1_MYCPH|nr:PP2C family serine/threonine-protein phosphatase [Mycolicibacterium phlei]VEG07001.1 serine/threonine protein phosphatase [Mycobacteroides chelonae]AMO58869.1 PP2C-family Ser/Thr phosphatase [Mycolicibacterium phlei]KAB7754599.1 potassium-transporting ATPase subunit B [Mycolicibacterium phlei DSM 43239 = CCUG 21000]KXW59908.1 potassium-transporting ATPase subunit B [Mycolicibacterium phlei DSM 43070]KXW65244.1 potassium-transporting ATPase subunit B [Mycolicibacterium phlei DSM 43239 = CCUG
MTLVLRYAARSDRGLVRANNEDSVYAGARLLALADGMGGHAAGEVASQLVIAALAHLDDDEPRGDLLSQLDQAVREGNSAIAAHVEADPELEGMGTTLTAILFAGNRLGLVHIGDSRGYLLRDGELTQITKDDTFVQTLVDEGRITAEEAHSHPQRSLIMRALTGHEVEPTLIMREARAGDRYLLCSDGLSDPVSHETILEALQIPDVAESADRLIELALRGGGPDNVTVVVADVVDNSSYDYGQTQPILAGAVSGDDDSPPPNTAAGRASAFNPRRNEPKRTLPEPEDEPRPPKSRRRMYIAAALVVLLALAGLAVGRQIIRNNYYVAAHDNTVSIMRGIPGSILGYSLQEPYRHGCLTGRNGLTLISPGQTPRDCELFRVDDLKPSEQRQVMAGLPTGSEDEAIGQINQLARDSLLPVCPKPQPAAPRTQHSPAPTNSPGVPNVPPTPRETPRAEPTPAPETPRTVTATPSAQPPAPGTGAAAPASESPSESPKPPPPPTVTALPPPEPEPGVNCREVS